jgi:hypothetical protein
MRPGALPSRSAIPSTLEPQSMPMPSTGRHGIEQIQEPRMSTITREMVDAVLKEIIDQVPTMSVRAVTMSPLNPREGENVIARIDVSGNRLVFCEINSDGSLHSARVIET